MSIFVVHSWLRNSFPLDLERGRRHLLEKRRNSSGNVETSQPRSFGFKPTKISNHD